MKINIPDSIKNKKVLINLLKSHEITIDKKADITLIERGMTIPNKGIAIIFDPDNLDLLIDLIDSFKNPASQHNKNFLIGKKKDSYELLKHDNILYFESYGNFVFCQTPTKKIEVNKKLYEIENDLLTKGFIRVNKSFIVNILNVSEIIPWFGGRLLLKFDGIDNEVEVSRNYTGQFKKFLGF